MPLGRRPTLLDEGMEHDRPSAVDVAEQRPADALITAATELEETAAQRTRPRHPQIGPKLHEQLDKARIVGKQAVRPSLNLGEDTLDGVRHEVSTFAN